MRADAGADLDEIEALRGKLATNKNQEDRLLDLYLAKPDEAPPNAVRERLDDFDKERAKLENPH